MATSRDSRAGFTEDRWELLDLNRINFSLETYSFLLWWLQTGILCADSVWSHEEGKRETTRFQNGIPFSTVLKKS